MKLKKKEALERRRFLTKAATVGGAGLAGALLMGGIDRSVLAGPSSSQTAILSKWAEEAPYDWIVFTDGTNYYAKNGDTGKIDFTNTTPDIFALLTSISNSVATGNHIKIFIKSGFYTGATTFNLGSGKGYTIEGEGHSILSGAGQTQPNFIDTGTFLKYTPSTGSAISGVNWTKGNQEMLVLKHFTISAPSTNGKVVDLINSNGSLIYDFQLYGNNVANSIGLNIPTTGNGRSHLIERFTGYNFATHIVVGAEMVTFVDLELTSGTTGISRIGTGGFPVGVFRYVAHILGGYALDDQRTGNFNNLPATYMFAFSLEGGGGRTVNAPNGAPYYFTGGTTSSNAFVRTNITNFNIPFNRTVTANYTADPDFDYIIIADATSGALTVTLPTAVRQHEIIVIKKDSSVNVVTVSRAGSDTIEGATTKSLTLQYGKAVLVADGTSTWYDIGTGLI